MIIMTGFLGGNTFAVTCCFLVFYYWIPCQICTIVTASLLGHMFCTVTGLFGLFSMKLVCISMRSTQLVSQVVPSYLTQTLTWFLTMYSYLLLTITTGCLGCWFLLEICIYNAKCSCYFQFHVTGFSSHMAYPLTWAC